MPRLSQLPSLSAAHNADEIAIVDVSASTTKKITRGDLLKAPLPTNSVTTAAIANGAVTAASISSSAIYLGHKTQTTDHNTGATNSRVDIAGFNVQVTVPVTTRKVKITLSVSDVLNASGSGTDTFIGVRDGSTVLIDRHMGVGNNSRITIPSIVWVGELTPGSHTIQVHTQNAVATNLLYGFSGTKSGLLLVELV